MKNAIKISDEKIVELVQPLLDDAQTWADQVSSERVKCAELYNMAKLGNEVDGFSQQVASVVFDTVNWLLPGLEEIFCSSEFIELSGDDTDQADRVKKLLRYQLFRRQKGAKAIREWLHDALMFHNSIFKIAYEQDVDMRSERYERLTLQDVQELVSGGDVILSSYDEVEEVVETEAGPQPVDVLENVKALRRVENYVGPKVECIPPWEFRISSGSLDIDSARVVSHQVKRTLHDIMMGEKTGQYRKGVAAKVKKDGERFNADHASHEERTALYEVDELDTGDITGGYQSDEAEAAPSSEYLVEEIYTRLDIDGDGLLEQVIVWKSGKVILNVIENPYGRPPFRAGKVFEVPHRFEGKPLPLLLRDDQVEMTNMQRIFTDAAAESTYGTLITSDATLANQWAKRTVADVIITTNSNSESFSFERPDQPGKTILEAMEMKRMNTERKTGVNSLNQGLTADSMGKTATGTMALQNAGQQRQRLYAKTLGEPFEDVIRDCIKINQMWPPKDAIRIVGREGLEVAPDDLQGEFAIRIDVGVGPQDKAMQAQHLEAHFQKLANVLIPQGVAGPEHLIKTELKIGKLLNTSFADLQFGEEEFNTIQQLQEQINAQEQEKARLNQVVEALSGRLQELHGQQQGQPLPGGHPGAANQPGAGGSGFVGNSVLPGAAGPHGPGPGHASTGLGPTPNRGVQGDPGAPGIAPGPEQHGLG